MNFKKQALALALAGTMALPGVSSAMMLGEIDGHNGEIYLSLRVGLRAHTEDTMTYSRGTGAATVTESKTSNKIASDTTIGNQASRFGVRGESAAMGDWNGYGHIEWSINTDSDAAALGTIRHGYAGVKNDSVDIVVGQTYHVFYDYVVGPADIPWWGSGFAMVSYRGRTDHTVGLQFGDRSDGFSAGLALVMDGSSTNAAGNSEALDEYEIGLSYAVPEHYVALGFISSTNRRGTASTTAGQIVGDTKPLTAFSYKNTMVEGLDIAVGYQTQEADFNANAASGIVNTKATKVSYLLDLIHESGVYFHYESLDNDGSDRNAVSTTLGYTWSMGDRTSMWFEYHSVAYDAKKMTFVPSTTAGDTTDIRAILKYDIL